MGIDDVDHYDRPDLICMRTVCFAGQQHKRPVRLRKVQFRVSNGGSDIPGVSPGPGWLLFKMKGELRFWSSATESKVSRLAQL